MLVLQRGPVLESDANEIRLDVRTLEQLNELIVVREDVGMCVDPPSRIREDSHPDDLTLSTEAHESASGSPFCRLRRMSVVMSRALLPFAPKRQQLAFAVKMADKRDAVGRKSRIDGPWHR